jgi:cytochrome c-type biogenesis protein CcmF
VGEPYFNRMAVPGGIAVLFLMGVGPMLPWGTPDRATVRRQLIIPSVVGLGVVGTCLAFGLRGFQPLLTFGLAGFVTVVTLRELFLPAKIRMTERKEAPWTAVVRSASKARRRFGGYIVHLGIVFIFIAIAASQSYVTHVQGTIKPGKTLQIGPYTVRFLGLASGEEPRRKFVSARVEVTSASGRTEELAPRMNYYERSTDPVGTPAVRSTAFEDLYLSLLAYSPDQGGQATLNSWIFPMVGWIWWSIPILVLGSLIAIWPSRRRAALAAPVPAVGGEGGAVASAQRGAA